jgi:aryl-alcohol dehydrogenase-like predicted oxidoreductase
MGPGLNQTGLSRVHVLAGIDASLERLGLDHVDLLGVNPGICTVQGVDAK